MIRRFYPGKYYKWIGPKERQPSWNFNGMMDFILDGRPHKCKDVSNSGLLFASFYDCEDQNFLWFWHQPENFIEVNVDEYSQRLLPF